MIVKGMLRSKALLSCSVIVFVLFGRTVLAVETASVPDNVHLADDVVPAPFGYEPITFKYVVTELTPLYISPYIYPGTANNNIKLQPGTVVEVLAKAKGYDWILVGKSGVGIGYLPISRLSKRAP
jgi:hypothetical protein